MDTQQSAGPAAFMDVLRMMKQCSEVKNNVLRSARLSIHSQWRAFRDNKIQDTNQFIGNHVGWIVIYIIHNTIQAS